MLKIYYIIVKYHWFNSKPQAKMSPQYSGLCRLNMWSCFVEWLKIKQWYYVYMFKIIVMILKWLVNDIVMVWWDIMMVILWSLMKFLSNELLFMMLTEDSTIQHKLYLTILLTHMLITFTLVPNMLQVGIKQQTWSVTPSYTEWSTLF